MNHLLRWDFAGVVIRRATEAGVYEGESYPSGLGVLDIQDTLSGMATTPEGMSVSVELLVDEVDIPASVAQGHRITASEVRIGRIDSLGQVRWLLVGRPRSPSYGCAAEPVAFTVSAQVVADAAWVPDAGAIISEARYAEAGETWDEESIGLALPIVFGVGQMPWSMSLSLGDRGQLAPAVVLGRNGSGEALRLGVCAYPVVDKSDLLAPGTYIDLVVEVTDGEGAALAAVENVVDQLGRAYAEIDLTGLSATVDRTAGEFWIQWQALPVLAGEGDTTTGARAVRGAGDLLIWLLRRSSVRVDLMAWEVARAELNQFDLSGYIDEQVMPLEYIQDYLLPLLPLSIQDGPAGMYPVIWPWLLPDSAAEVLLEDGRNIEVEELSEEGDETSVYNSFSLFYRWYGLTQQCQAQVRLVPTIEDPAVDASSTVVRVSEQHYGLREAEPIETRIISDEATARLVLHHLAAAQREVPRLATGIVSHEIMDSLRVGALVHLRARRPTRDFHIDGTAIVIELLDAPQPRIKLRLR